MDFDQVADELYGVPPNEFTAARNAAADRARAAGDARLAARIRRLRRPTLAAWLANLLTRRFPEETRTLLDLGTALRDAQAELDGQQLRELTAQRRAVVTALTRQARQAARQAGVAVGEGPQRELEETLQAVLSDEETAAVFATGRLRTAQGPRPEGIDVTRSDAPGTAAKSAGGKAKAAGGASGKGGAAGGKAHDDERARAAEQRRRRLAEARRRAAEAERAAAAAEAEAAAARRELERASAQHERLRRKVEELSSRLEQARQEERDAAAAERSARARVESSDRAARTARGRASDAAAHRQHLDSEAA